MTELIYVSIFFLLVIIWGQRDQNKKLSVLEEQQCKTERLVRELWIHLMPRERVEEYMNEIKTATDYWHERLNKNEPDEKPE